MTIDINKVRVQLASDDIIDHIELHANLKPILTTFLDRLEAAEGERDWPEYEPTWKAIEARVSGAQSAPKAVAYLDLGVGGYMDIGTEFTDEELATLPKGRHMLGIVGTYGVDGYVPAQPSPSVPECPYPCGWRNLLKLAIEDGAYLARSINTDEPVTENARAVTMRIVLMLRDVLMAINAAAQEANPCALARMNKRIAKRDRRIAGLERRIRELEHALSARLDFPNEIEKAVERALCNVRMIPVSVVRSVKE